MASTQAEAEASRNGPESKESDGPSTNGVEAQRDNDSNSTNGPTSAPLTNNGPHEPTDINKMSAGAYYKPPPPQSGYPGYPEGGQYAYPGYMQPSDMQQAGSYPYQQYPGANVRSMAPIPSKPAAYMPRNPQSGPGYPPANAAGQGYPPSRYPTPTLNQLLQPGSGQPVQRYPYDYPQQGQQPPGNWSMQQPRNYAPNPGFKPPNSMPQQQQQYPAYSPGLQAGAPQRYPGVSPGAPIHPQQQDTVKSSSGLGETSADTNANASGQRNSSSPSVSVSSAPNSTPSSAVSSSPTTTSTTTTASAAAAGANSAASSPAVGARPPAAPSPANRPMSPALGPANNNSSSSNHNVSPSPENSSGRVSHSPMAAQGAYQQPMPPPPHVGMPPYKMSPGPYQQPPPPQQPMQQSGPGQQPQQPQYLPNPMYMQHPRPPGPNMYAPGSAYGPPPPQQQPPPPTSTPGALPPSSNANPNNPMPPASPGPNRPMPPHMGPPTPYPGYPSGPGMGQYGQQQQPGWGPNSMPGGPPGSPMPGGKGSLAPPPPSGPGTPRPAGPPHTPPHYTKQHLQHHLQQQQQQKMYGMAPSPGSGPPSSVQGPQPPNQSQMGPYPPPGMPNASSIAGHPPSAASPVTNIVTTGPDGVAGLDEASQQSTLSNTSAASGDDGSTPSTPRPRKETPAHHPPFSQQHQLPSHPATPQSTAPSPGTGQTPSQHEEFREGQSPAPNSGNWKATPASPVRNPESKKSHVSDALLKLYEFDDHPDRKKFLDQLLRFMDEKGTPITACPAISKNPLDLFRLYMLVRERGGFLEVTKNKTWKDIAQTLGIGASSSAAYTLRKHYTKSLFPWECKFDRGGVDPQPILNQVEASTKKKPPSKALSVPSPAGSSNSQDSFPASGVPPIPSMDGYPNSHYPGYPQPHTGENIAASNPFDDQQHHYGGRPAHPGYPPPPPPPGPQQAQQQPPQQQPPGPTQQAQQPSQPMYRPGYPGMNHPNQGYHHPYQGEYPNSQQYPPYPPNRTMYPPYGEPYNSQAPPAGQGPPPPSGAPPAADPYGRYMPPNAGAPNAPYMPRPPAPSATPASAPSHAQPMPQQPAQPQPPQGNTSAGPSPAPSPAPNVVAPTYTEQNEQYQQRSGLRQLLASSPLAQQLATPSSDRQSGYGAAPSNLGPPSGQPYPGLIRPGTPGPNTGAPRPAAPTPPIQPPSAMGQSPAPPAPGAPVQQPNQAPYPPYGPPGQPGSQPRQPFGWRGAAPYANQYPSSGPGSTPGPVQTVGAPWVPPTGNQQPRNPAWDQAQRYPGPMPGSPAAPYNGTSQGGPPAPATPGLQPPPPPQQQQPPPQQQPQQPVPQPPPPQSQQWSSPQMANARPPFPRPPYRPADGKPYPMPPMPGKPMMQYPQQTPMSMYQPKSQFPPDSVEAVTPVYSKRRRICRADVAPVDAWRVYLALKSGLLAESTWAIDVLNVLLFDDASVHYFTLAYMPGLLEVLLEHFRRCLREIFSILEDMEIGYDRIEELNAQRKKKAVCSSDSSSSSSNNNNNNKREEDGESSWWSRKKPDEPEDLDEFDLGAVKAADLNGERVKVLDGPDMSIAARRKKKIGVVPRDKELFISDKRKIWDVHEGFDSGMDQWLIGGGDTTQHIITHFTAELNILPFVRVMRKEKRPESPVVDEKDDKEPEVKFTTIKNCLAKKTRSLADVLQRIKKEDTEPKESQKEAAKELEPVVEIKKEPEEAASEKETPAPERQEKSEGKSKLLIRDPHSTLKRRHLDDYEDECYTRDETSLYLVDDSQDALSRRALALSNILRSLSFVPTNELELARNAPLLVIIGKLLLLHHDHPLRSANQKNYDREEDVDFSSESATKADDWWWMDTLLNLRENALVVLANIAGQLDMSNYSEEIVRPLIDGLLHWAVCPSAQAQDPFGSFGPNSTSLLSPQRLSLEALCKLLVLEANVDLILATPPFSRIEKLVQLLTKSLCRTEDQVLREFAVNVLYYLSAADSGMARLISMHNNSLGLLVSFIEQAESNALVVASQHGIQALRENPESMGTSLDMLRRAASTVFHISRHPESKQLLAKLEQRLLALVMSQIMDQSVAALLSKSLYLCNTDDD